LLLEKKAVSLLEKMLELFSKSRRVNWGRQGGMNKWRRILYKWETSAKEMGMEKYHLLIQDIGGPIAFAMAAENKEKVLSLTLLNT
jgi:hypothetical protein